MPNGHNNNDYNRAWCEDRHRGIDLRCDDRHRALSKKIEQISGPQGAVDRIHQRIDKIIYGIVFVAGMAVLNFVAILATGGNG